MRNASFALVDPADGSEKYDDAIGDNQAQGGTRKHCLDEGVTHPMPSSKKCLRVPADFAIILLGPRHIHEGE